MNRFPSLVATLLALALLSCGPNGDKHTGANDTPNAGQNDDSANADNQTEDKADKGDKSSDQNTKTDDPTDHAIAELDDQSYEDVRGSADCTEDCSGHNAGWEWAKQHRVLNPDDCSGNSESFIEGCKAYAEEVEDRANAE